MSWNPNVLINMDDFVKKFDKNDKKCIKIVKNNVKKHYYHHDNRNLQKALENDHIERFGRLKENIYKEWKNIRGNNWIIEETDGTSEANLLIGILKDLDVEHYVFNG